MFTKYQTTYGKERKMSWCNVSEIQMLLFSDFRGPDAEHNAFVIRASMTATSQCTNYMICQHTRICLFAWRAVLIAF